MKRDVTERFDLLTARRLLGWHWLAMSMLCLSMTWAQAANPAPRPNIVMIVIDTLRADHVGCYGSSRPATPAIDACATSGVRCARAVATSCWTMPATMSILTGRYPSAHGADSYTHRLASGLPTLAELLTKGGYQTAGIAPNPTIHGKFGFGRGFEFYDDFTIIFDLGFQAVTKGDARSPAERSTVADTTRLALNWLDRREVGKPFFLFAFYLDPHYEYVPTPPYDTMFADPTYAGPADGRGIKGLPAGRYNEADKRQTVALYDGEVRQTDDQIAALLRGLDERGAGTNTLVLIVADHGEEFWDHDGTAHGHTLHRELVDVPLVWRWPGVLPAGRVLQSPVSQVDVLPTLLEAAGLPPLSPCDGISLWSALRGGQEPPSDRPLFIENAAEHVQTAVRRGALKVILNDPKDHCRFYDLAADPGEQRDLFGTERGKDFATVEAMLGKFLAARPATSGHGEAEGLDPRLMRQLRSMGYAK